MRVLLSIKPQFAERIFDGSKKFEFRKTIFKNKSIKTVVVYASSPVQKVIGEFEIEDIINDKLESLWRITKHHAGIEKDYFYEYFANKEEGFAIKIKNVIRYPKPLSLKENFNVFPPQSFLYLNGKAK
jgi:predicted transcriptional regulator